MGEKRLTILLPEDLETWLTDQAKAQDRSVAAQLRIILRETKERQAAAPAA